jgi:hypothetical protein
MEAFDRTLGTIERKFAATVVAYFLTAAAAGAATAASPGSSERDLRKDVAVLTQVAPERATQTVWVGQANPSAAEPTAVAESSVAAPLPAAADQDQPNAGALVLAVLGLALWVGARLRRQD